jgi:hypothetical protein
MIQQSRRGFIAGLGALFVAAPAIVRAASIMPVKAIRQPTIEEISRLLHARMEEAYRITREQMARELFGVTQRTPQFVGYGGGFTVNDGTFNVPRTKKSGPEFSLKEWVMPVDLSGLSR